MNFKIKNNILLQCSPKDETETEVTVPLGVTEIAADAFQYCKYLKRITLPESITAIGDSAFYYCWNLQEINLPDSITAIGNFAFFECTSLCSICLPENLKIISEGTFYSCSALKSITVPMCVKSVRDSAFFHCRSLAEITLHPGITALDDLTFEKCEALKIIRLSPDDPALYRDYGDVEYLGAEIQDALEMLRTGNYSIRVHAAVKYPLAILHWLRTGEKETGEFLRKHITSIMKDSIAYGDTVFIQQIVKTDEFLRKEHLDRFILQAQNTGKHEIAALLMDYKHRYVGFSGDAELL